MKYFQYKTITYILLLLLSTSLVHAKDSAIIVFDGSGSMWGQIEGKTKIEIARDVMGTLVSDWNTDIDLGLIAYGHRNKGDCSDIEVLQPVSPINSHKILQEIYKISPKGKTPISRSLKQAAETLRYTEDSATVILVSDGEETCKADPCAVAKELEAQGVNFTAHVIGFDVKNNKNALKQLKCIAENTGGQFFEADNAASLKESLIKVKEAVVDPRLTACKSYAKSSVTHEQTNIDKECGFKGEHWNAEYTTHYDWCMAQEIGSVLANNKNQKRVTELESCQKSKIKTVVIKTNIGKLQLINNQQTYVRALDQTTGEQKGIFGNKVDSTIQLPAGTYQLKFNHFFIDDVKISAGEKNTLDVSKLIGWLTLANNQQSYVRAMDQMTGKQKGIIGNNPNSTIQLPVGTYKLKFNDFEIDNIKITAGEKNTLDVSKLIGWLTLTNNQQPYVRAMDQMTGKQKGIIGNNPNSTIQLPVGTYKLKFNDFEIDDIKITAGEKNTFDVSKFIGWLTLSNNNQAYVRALDQNTGKQKGIFGNNPNSTIQLPAGKYKLKFNNFEIDDVLIEAGQKLVLKLEQ